MPNHYHGLLARTAADEKLLQGSMSAPDHSMLLIMLVAGGFFVLLVIWIIVRGMKMSERSRELQHAERVKAIEAGQPWQDPADPPEQSLGNRFWICFWIMLFGAAVPFMSISSSLTHIEDVQELVMLAAYISAGVTGATASICATIIMCSSAKRANRE